MDSDIVGAVGAVEVDRDGAYALFVTIVEVHGQAGADWDTFTNGVAAAGVVAPDQVENLLRYIEDNGDMDLVDRIAALGAVELLGVYDELRAGATDADDDTDASMPDYWTESVAAYGEVWAGFTGTDESWAEHRDRFYAYTNSYDPAAYAIAYERLSPLDSAQAEDRIAALQSYGFPVTAPAEDGGPWATLVAAHGAQWAAFDGSEEGWAATRDQFYRDAHELDPALYELAYQRLSPLETLLMAPRIEALRELGLPVTAEPAQENTQDDGTDLSDEEAAAILEQAMLDA